MKEIWKDIDGYEGKYQVSNLGNVKSLNWRNLGFEKNLCQKLTNKGYLIVGLSGKEKVKYFTVHRLVAKAFLKNPNCFEEVNHKDENTKNNRIDNLEWCTHQYNVDYFLKKHPDHAKNRKETKKYKKRLNLKVLQFSKNGEFIKEWPNSRSIFVETGMSDWSISQCCRGKQKSANGYIWRYAK